MQLWVGIDVGIKNLGIVKVLITEDYHIDSVLFAEKIDLTELKHDKVTRSKCTLYHTNDAVDRLDHFLQEYCDIFQNVSKIFIERQPITGLVHIEQLLYSRFRDTAMLVSPNAMHKHFHISHLNYDQRKEETVKIAKEFIEPLHLKYDRMHDISDAFCIFLYQLQLKREEYRKKQIKIQVDGKNILIKDFFEKFRFVH